MPAVSSAKIISSTRRTILPGVQMALTYAAKPELFPLHTRSMGLKAVSGFKETQIHITC